MIHLSVIQALAAAVAGVISYNTNITTSDLVFGGELVTNGPAIYERWTNATALGGRAFALDGKGLEIFPVGRAQQVGKAVVVTNTGIGGARIVTAISGQRRAFTVSTVNAPSAVPGSELRLRDALPGTYFQHLFTNIVAAIGTNGLRDASTARITTGLDCPTNIRWKSNGWFVRICTNWNFLSVAEVPLGQTNMCGKVWYQRPWTMLTSRHGVTAGHMYPAVGTAVLFLARDGTPIWRTNVYVTNTLFSTTAFGDFALGVLNADLPADVAPAFVFDGRVEKITGFARQRINQADYAEVMGVSAPAFFATVTGGDSGSPFGFVWMGRWTVSPETPAFFTSLLPPEYHGTNVTPAQRIAFLGALITNANAALGIPQTYSLTVLNSNALGGLYVP
jgi:hypothetical protein